MTRNIKTISTDDFDAVVATAQRYVDGMVAGKSEVLAGAFFEEAVMYGVNDDRLIGGPIRSLYDFIDQSGSAPQMKARIDVLDITPSTAMVRVDLEKDATGTDYTDYHALIKRNGQWNVVAKVFHIYAN